jgi:hypothetical protein
LKPPRFRHFSFPGNCGLFVAAALALDPPTPIIILRKSLRTVGADRTLRKTAEASCNDCYFRQAGLCALVVDAACPTFRAAKRGALAPPRQAQLVPRASGDTNEQPAAA